jgi:hypothetical protein
MTPPADREPTPPILDAKGSEMVIRLFQIARLLERVSHNAAECLTKHDASENHESRDSRYCDRDCELNE